MARMHLTRMELVALVCLLAAVATQVQVSLGKHAHHVHHGHHSHNHGHGTGADKHDKRKDDTWLDAFDEEICGETNLRPWQREQSAFGCAKASNSYEPSNDLWAQLGLGQRAIQGEFPFYVRIVAIRRGKTEYCSGILVSRDIVITTADSCLRPDSGTINYVEVHFGANMYEGAGEVAKRPRRWCTSPNNGLPEPGKELSSVAVKRAASCKEGHKMLPNENCYVGKDTGKICEGDRGGPLVCYDKCSEKDKGKVQAFVVGALSQYDNHYAYSDAPSTVIDFEKSHSRIMELLRAVRDYKFVSTDRIKCVYNVIPL